MLTNTRPIKKILAVIFTVFPAVSFAFFGPKNFDDCVLKSMKGVTSDEAAKLIYSSCLSKFPSAEDKKAISEQQKTEQRYKNCGMTTELRNSNGTFYIDSFQANPQSEKFQQVLTKIIIEEYNAPASRIKVHNKNDFPISKVVIGLTKSKSCPSNYNDYDAIAECGGGLEWLGAQKYGPLKCSAIPPKTRRHGYCLIGYAPTFNSYDDSLLAHMENRGYCKNTLR